MTQFHMSVPYYPVLCIIRQELEQEYDDYPMLKCQHAARAVTRVLAEQYAIQEVAGLYIPARLWHAWNYDSEREIYVDLSMDQFKGQKLKITILAATTPLVKRDRERTLAHKQTMQKPFAGLEDVIERSNEKVQKLSFHLTC